MTHVSLFFICIRVVQTNTRHIYLRRLKLFLSFGFLSLRLRCFKLCSYITFLPTALYEISLKHLFAGNIIKAPATNSTELENSVPILLSFIGFFSLSVIRSLCALASSKLKHIRPALEDLYETFQDKISKSLARQK